MLKFKKILCPIDFSEASYEGLDTAVSLADNDTSQLCLMHVAPSWRATAGSGLNPYIHDEPTRRAAVVTALCEVLSRRVPDNIRARPVLDYGDAAIEIVRTALEEKADLIVLATHGIGGWKRESLGSVTEAVLRTAPCPVLVVTQPCDHHLPTPPPEQEPFLNPQLLPSLSR